MNLINIGVGVRPPSQTENQEQVNGEVKVEAGEEEADEDEALQAAMARDVQFFRVVVEESDERFEGDEGENRIREVVQILKDCMRPKSWLVFVVEVMRLASY